MGSFMFGLGLTLVILNVIAFIGNQQAHTTDPQVSALAIALIIVGLALMYFGKKLKKAAMEKEEAARAERRMQAALSNAQLERNSVVREQIRDATKDCFCFKDGTFDYPKYLQYKAQYNSEIGADILRGHVSYATDFYEKQIRSALLAPIDTVPQALRGIRDKITLLPTLYQELGLSAAGVSRFCSRLFDLMEGKTTPTDSSMNQLIAQLDLRRYSSN